MTLIHRVFFMSLDQLALVVINFLPEAQRGFIRIHYLAITRLPAEPARDFKPITPSAAGQFIPMPEFLFVLNTRAHGLIDKLMARPPSDNALTFY